MEEKYTWKPVCSTNNVVSIDMHKPLTTALAFQIHRRYLHFKTIISLAEQNLKPPSDMHI